jgi:hypothetical protein
MYMQSAGSPSATTTVPGSQVRVSPSLATTRVNGDRTHEVATLQRMGVLHRQQGSASAALPWLAQAQSPYQALDDAVGEGMSAAHAAVCQTGLGQTAAALSTVEGLLMRLDGEPADRPAHETIPLRWTCQQVLEAPADARAALMLAQLFADVQVRATELTDAADRDRLIQDQPIFRAIVAAAG